MMKKWSDHTSDICPYCGGHTAIWASTYAFNFAFMECQFCKGLSQSAFVDMMEFQWIIPDWDANRIYMEAHEMVSEVLN